VIRSRRARPLSLAALALSALALSACAGTVKVSSRAICEAAGGSYADGTCSNFGPGARRAEQMCEAQGGVYLLGEDVCAMGGGVK
jgi:hypothetical protein